MISYSDYDGPQDDVVVRDGQVVPFDRDAAREMAHHAHMLAIDVSEQAASVGTSEQPAAAAAQLSSEFAFVAGSDLEILRRFQPRMEPYFTASLGQDEDLEIVLVGADSIETISVTAAQLKRALRQAQQLVEFAE